MNAHPNATQAAPPLSPSRRALLRHLSQYVSSPCRNHSPEILRAALRDKQITRARRRPCDDYDLFQITHLGLYSLTLADPPDSAPRALRAYLLDQTTHPDTTTPANRPDHASAFAGRRGTIPQISEGSGIRPNIIAEILRGERQASIWEADRIATCYYGNPALLTEWGYP